jgi:prevent-host-death family protein
MVYTSEPVLNRVTTSKARKNLADLVNAAYYAKTVTMITRRGKDIAAIVPASIAVQSAGNPPKRQPNKKRA